MNLKSVLKFKQEMWFWDLYKKNRILQICYDDGLICLSKSVTV
jgi:hypothetical protein